MTTQRSGWRSRGQRVQQPHRLKYSPLCLSLSQTAAPSSLPALEVVIEPAAPVNLEKENNHPNSLCSPPSLRDTDAAFSSSFFPPAATSSSPPPFTSQSVQWRQLRRPFLQHLRSLLRCRQQPFTRLVPLLLPPLLLRLPVLPFSPVSSQPVSFRHVQLTAPPRRPPTTDPAPRTAITSSATSASGSFSPPRHVSPALSSSARAASLAASAANGEASAVSFSSHKLRFLASHPTVTKHVDKVRQALATHRLREDRQEERREDEEDEAAAVDNSWMFDSWSPPGSPVSPAASSQSSSLSPSLPALPSSASSSSTSPSSAASTASTASLSSSLRPADSAAPQEPLPSTLPSLSHILPSVDLTFSCSAAAGAAACSAQRTADCACG